MNTPVHLGLLMAVAVAILGGCATESDLSQEAFARHYANGTQFHPKGARLNRDQAIRFGVEAFERMGFRSEDLGDPGALYIGNTQGFLGIKHKTWDVSFANKSGSAARYPTLSVYVNDGSGKTDVVEKGAHP